MNKIIFAVKPVDLGRISQIGFSLDNVLVMYTRQFYSLIYDLVKNELIERFRYPKDVLEHQSFTQHFASAAYVVDPDEGTAMQIDEFSNITACVRGHCKLAKQDYTYMYPERSIKLASGKYYVQGDSFSQVFVCLYMDLIEAFFVQFYAVRDPLCETEQALPLKQSGQVVPRLLFQDVWQAYDAIVNGARTEILQEVQKQPEIYFKVQTHLRDSIIKLRQARQLFILTNTEFQYAEFCLKYVYGADYRYIFDYLIFGTDLTKFETSAQPFRRYEEFRFLGGTGPIQRHQPYCNGNFNLFVYYTHFKPKDTLYCCDVLPDMSISNKRAQWHYCVIVPSISREAKIMDQQIGLQTKISGLEQKQRQILGKCGLHSFEKPQELTIVQNALENFCQRYMDCFGLFGSKYQTSWALTKLGDDIIYKADLYTNSVANFYYYSQFYYFTSSPNTRFLPHQTAIHAVQDENRLSDEEPSDKDTSAEMSIKSFK